MDFVLLHFSSCCGLTSSCSCWRAPAPTGEPLPLSLFSLFRWSLRHGSVLPASPDRTHRTQALHISRDMLPAKAGVIASCIIHNWVIDDWSDGFKIQTMITINIILRLNVWLHLYFFLLNYGHIYVDVELYVLKYEPIYVCGKLCVCSYGTTCAQLWIYLSYLYEPT
jgi:hypothetical protein